MQIAKWFSEERKLPNHAFEFLWDEGEAHGTRQWGQHMRLPSCAPICVPLASQGCS